MKRLLGVALLIWSQACTETDVQIDQEPPRITIQSPEEMGTYPAGEALPITVIIRENLELHTYRVELVHPASKTAFILDEQHTHEEEVVFRQDFVLPPLKGATYELQVQADDHEGNLQEAIRTFRTDP